MKVNVLNELLSDIDENAEIYITEDDSDDSDLELISIKEGFKSKFGNYIVLRNMIV